MAVEITIDCNNDEIHIVNEDDGLHLSFHKPKDMQALQVLIQEILHAVEPKNVSLIREDEDTRTGIDEW